MYLWVVIRTQKDRTQAEQVFALEEDDDRGGGDVRRGGPSAVEHTEGGGTTFVTGSCSRCSLLRVVWATRCDRSRDALTLLDRRRVLDHPRVRIIALHLDHVIIPGLNVSAVVSWDTPKFAAPNPDSSLPFRPSGWVDRSDGPQRNSGGSPQGNEI